MIRKVGSLKYLMLEHVSFALCARSGDDARVDYFTTADLKPGEGRTFFATAVRSRHKHVRGYRGHDLWAHCRVARFLISMVSEPRWGRFQLTVARTRLLSLANKSSAAFACTTVCETNPSARYLAYLTPRRLTGINERITQMSQFFYRRGIVCTKIPYLLDLRNDVPKCLVMRHCPSHKDFKCVSHLDAFLFLPSREFCSCLFSFFPLLSSLFFVQPVDVN